MSVLCDRLRRSLETITPDFEILLVEDCGSDQSWPVILGIARSDPRVKGLRLSRNFGQHHAITSGLDACDGDWVVVMDCDLQDEPEEIPRLYAKAIEGHHVVVARRTWRGDNIFKRGTSWMFYRVFGYLTDSKWDSRVGVYCIISRVVVEQLRLMREQLRFFVGLVDWMGFPAASIEVKHAERHAGSSSYTIRKRFRLGGHAVMAFSDKPLRMAITLGCIISLFALAHGSYIAVRFLLYGSPITGWSGLIVTLQFLGGLIISILGILGVYLGKVFDEVKKRPLYVVRERVNL